MGKTGLKTFVCSFSFSLLAFVWAGKEWLAVSQPSQSEIIIPNKNISLFFKDMPAKTVAAKAIPIKKIALSVPKIPEVQENPALPQDKKAQENNIVIAKKDLIPLTFADNNIEFDVEPQNIDLNKNQAKSIEPEKVDTPTTPKIVQNYSEFIAHKPEIENSDIRETDDSLFDAKMDEALAGKTLQAKVQILRPNAKNVQKALKLSDAPVEDNLQLANTEKEIIPIIENNKKKTEFKGNAEPTEPENHVIAMVPDKPVATPQKNNNQPTKDLPPTFKVARAKTNPDNQLKIAESQEIPVDAAHEPKNLLIPLETDDNAPLKENAKIATAPENNKLAMLNAKASIHSMEQKIAANDTPENTDASDEGWQTMAEKNSKTVNAWVAARGAGHIANSKIKDEQYYKSADKKILKKVLRDETKPQTAQGDVQLASETVDNLLIPIPEDILNDPNLTPQLVSSPQGKELEEKITEQENQTYGTTAPQKESPNQIAKREEKSDDKGLLQSITSIFKKSSGNEQASDESDSESFFDRLKNKTKKSEYSGKILPTEIRLAFQPNRAEISGVTLKWLQAFANKINEDKNAGLEIRIDGSSSYELQQKRLNLLNNILASNGVDFSKVNTIFTTREPNSFIIRTVRINNSNDSMEENNDWQDYYKVW